MTEPTLPLLVTAALLRHGGRVLITQRREGTRDGGLWEFPGGKVHPGESPEECLQREMREELDLEVAVGRPYDVLYHRYAWGAVLLLVYECHLLGGTLTHREVADHRWVRPSALEPEMLLPADRPLVERLRREAGTGHLAPIL